MKKILLPLVSCVFSIYALAQSNSHPTELVDYVNPLMGTDSKEAFPTATLTPL
ncbi:hypothetical protein KRR40_47085 [Niabella defluvii]|nr:hypothetical protein KRR40_47085 [Niabella sp. I65]